MKILIQFNKVSLSKSKIEKVTINNLYKICDVLKLEGKMNRTAYIALGANVGDRVSSIKKAIYLLDKNPEISVKKVSSLYETEPVEYPDQEWFINVVLEVKTSLKPPHLLELCQKIESEFQKDEVIPWGPRNIDIDILLYEKDLISETKLQIPHLRMHARACVLIPLSEIAENMLHPILNKTPMELYNEIQNPTIVRKFGQELELETQAV